ncbi:MAG: hypothetical protein PCFJNLEI_03218 [Verrucomicrobiae bacterium]|nr:hypothetical protein [Verrucomicrobiae bacterium]
MRALRGMVGILIVVSFMVPLASRAAKGSPKKLNKVIIYPTADDSVAQLKQGGVEQVRDFGSYWIAEVTDEQVKGLQRKHGDRLQKADHFNRLELAATTFDTTVGEPAVPVQLKERSVAGKRRLRLVQFNAPVQPGWLEQLQAAGKVKVINYVPNNAFLVMVDAAAETKLQTLREPAGPIQWIGAYHPYYKLPDSLQNVTEPTVRVRLAVVDDADAAQAVEAVQRYALGPVSAPRYLLNQINLELTLRPVDLQNVAALPSVLWVRQVLPMRQMDEPQALVLATSDSGPAPVRYLDFLQNKVGASQNPNDYPVLDIADSGIDSTHPCFSVPTFSVSPDMSCFNFFGSKIVYTFGSDTDGHGTVVASVAAGFDDFPDEIINCITEKTVESCVTNLVFGCITNGFTIGGGVECSGPTPPACCATLTCTNFNITCGYTTNVVCTNTCEIVTNKPAPPFPVTVYRQEISSGLQLGMGISPFGRIGSSKGGASDDFLGPFDHALNIYLRAARISNNSWGEICCTSAGDYNDFSQAYDALTRDAVNTGSTNPPTPGPSPVNQELLYVFAGGNANGLDGTGGFGDVLVTPPATAKNIITVGASTKTDPGGLASFTSFGPTLDGRFKPDIMAPGVGIYGATSQDTYTQPLCGGCDPNSPFPAPCTEGFHLDPTITLLYSRLVNGITAYSGTSVAAPAVAGAAQLLWWYFQNRLLMLQPSPAMTKAYICNAARYLPLPNPLTGTTDQLPSSAQGMGRLDLDRMFDTVPRVIRDQSIGRAIDSPLLTTNPVTQQTYFNRSGQSYEVSGSVADSTKPFRVTLAWSDVPGTPGNGPQLVNNLDLVLTIGGKSYFGNVFDREFSKTGGTPDVLNNMESVFLPAGQTGSWSLVVRAVNLPGKALPNIGASVNQDFALVVYNGNNASDLPNLATNDTCQTAIEITSYPFAWTNNLTPTVYHNNHPSPAAGRGGIEEFFTIVYPTPGTVFTANTIGSSFNTLLSVWRGTCGGLEEVTSNNDASNTTQSAVSWTVSDTNIYYIVAEGLQDKSGKLALQVTATPPPFGFTTALVDFGSHYVGTSTNITVTLQNQTTVSANIFDVTIGGLNPGDYSIESDNCKGLSIPPGGTCTITISFAPTVVGTRTATLLVADDITGSPHSLPLTGVGLAPVPLFCPNAVSSLAFGEVTTGTFSPEQFLVITNCGTADLLITNAVVVGVASNEFVITTDLCSGNPIAPGETCSIGVKFVPGTAGVRTATLRINDNTATSPHTVGLSGTGRAPAPVVCLSPTSVSFANVPVGTTSVVTSVTVTNCGTAPLTITSVSVIGASSSQFVLVSSDCVGGSIATGAACVVQVQFAPTSIGPATATLQIIDNAAGSPHTVTLNGLGTGSQPDGQIAAKNKAKYYLGNNIINLTGDAQEAIQKGKRAKPGKAGKPRYFYISVQNDGNTSDSYTVAGPTSLPGFASIRYFLGASPKQDLLDITGAVGAGTYTTASLAVGATTGDATLIRVEFIVDSLAVAGSQSFLVTLTSTSNPAKQDAVKATITVK